MRLYFSKAFFAEPVEGSVVRVVACEKCSTAFGYELKRVGFGSASAPYYLGQKSAKLRAERKAQKHLARQLACDVEMVPCPKCRWVNVAAIKAYRKPRYKSWGLIALFPFLVALVVASPMLAFISLVQWVDHPVLWYVLYGVIALLLIAGMLLMALMIWVEWEWNRWVDPNQWVDGQRQPVVPPNTPSAMLVEQTSDGGIIVVPVDDER